MPNTMTKSSALQTNKNACVILLETWYLEKLEIDSFEETQFLMPWGIVVIMEKKRGLSLQPRVGLDLLVSG